MSAGEDNRFALSFDASDQSGTRYTIDVEEVWVTDGVARKFKGRTYATGHQVVIRLEKGKYRTGDGVILRTTDPNEPDDTN